MTNAVNWMIGKGAAEICGAYYLEDTDCGPDPDGSYPLAPIKEELLGLEWLSTKTARHEYFMSTQPRTYSYGNRGTGKETYHSRPFSAHVRKVMDELNGMMGTNFNVCFLNKYDNQHNHLGWHADNFADMNADQPIMVISFGAEREIWLKDNRGFKCPRCNGTGYWENPSKPGSGDHLSCPLCLTKGLIYDPNGPPSTGFINTPINERQPDDQRVLLKEGSFFLMPEGYQDTHVHRIPKHGRDCGWRISLTFRSFKDVEIK